MRIKRFGLEYDRDVAEHIVSARGDSMRVLRRITSDTLVNSIPLATHVRREVVTQQRVNIGGEDDWVDVESVGEGTVLSVGIKE